MSSESAYKSSVTQASLEVLTRDFTDVAAHIAGKIPSELEAIRRASRVDWIPAERHVAFHPDGTALAGGDYQPVSGTLTFGGQPFLCVLPWTAVYAAMVEGEQRGTVWPEDVPEDVLTGTAEAPAPVPPAAEAAPTPTRAKRQSHLKLVE